MGVKSLWSLLEPVGRPVPLETIEGKALAIDSSIWIYQFQATMRDKDGRALVNAHVLGFLRRICKLLFYGVRPVFVFDGGAPALKRNTISERKKKKSGAAASHVRLAERLLAAQMRREALVHSQASHAPPSKTGQKGPSGPVLLDEHTVYLEDIDNSIAKTPAKKNEQSLPPSSKKKNRFHDHDPYKLPEVNLEDQVAKVTRSHVPDPRLATEEELRTFIEEMRPEDFDVTSPAFRELPTEVQYEIVGDLRLKSRQTSYKRLQNMLRKATTPLDFSREQIKNLQQRNALTQQLLMTTDSIGKAHITIPIRIASERNREYVLIKNEGPDGGWVLGIQDTGTHSNPIEIDQDKHVSDSDDDDDDMDMEEVSIPPNTYDSGVAGHQQSLGISATDEHPQFPVVSGPVQRRVKAQPLFDFDEDDELPHLRAEYQADEEDPDLAAAIQASLDTRSSDAQAQLLQTLPVKPLSIPTEKLHISSSRSGPALPDDDGEDLYASPSRLETALSIAGAGPKRRPSGKVLERTPSASLFGRPSLLASARPSITSMTSPPHSLSSKLEQGTIPLPQPLVEIESLSPSNPPPPPVIQVSRTQATCVESTDDDAAIEEVTVVVPSSASSANISSSGPHPQSMGGIIRDEAPEFSVHVSFNLIEPSPSPQYPKPMVSHSVPHMSLEESDEDSVIQWSRSPSPVSHFPKEGVSNGPRQAEKDESWDAAQEMDPHQEEGEFARFISQVKGRDLDAVRHEIDEEIKALNRQKKAAMRDSEDITQHMISQIMLMLRLFGIPYITAPMEAEAQCAELVSLGLVEGIITDDSDVFLFGGLRVFKNMFNQSKTVECFLLSDLSRELGLERDALVRLAYLLGSDYVEGLPGVGPVVAMELLKAFPGEDGLHKFKDWWTKVQSGRDREEDNKTKFRNRFKKKYKDLYLPSEWPNPLRDAYYHPTVDSSEEPFKWGMPDLDALRHFLHEELGWNQSKVDDLLLPIIQKMNRRNQADAMNRQGNLNGFFDMAPGAGSYAPRKRQAYGSKRLQQVVADFRKEQAKTHGRSTSLTPEPDESDHDELITDNDTAHPKKKTRTALSRQGKGKASAQVEKSTAKKSATRRNGKGTRPKASSSSKSGKANGDSSSEGRMESGDEFAGASGKPSRALAVQLRPRAKSRSTHVVSELSPLPSDQVS
ncbi:hypothetical protein F5I97DRAFT_1812007 [Phlebopus sp. FC_14]|nr:hypothetical protein F5I97DRAFT_1812007 [Phlebopus sp. FC_14]